MADKQITVNADNLKDLMVQAYGATGMSPGDAAYAAQCMLSTNLWGVDSHGALRLPIYIQRLGAKVVNPTPDIKQIGGMGALALMDGDAGLGYVVGREAMAKAIELAKTHGVGFVTVKNSNHFGAAAIFAREAAEAGMIGMAFTNVGPLMVVPGGSKPIAGNNPLSIAAPTYGDFPFVLDISLSQVAGGKLLLAKEKGEKIPLDWAADKDGRPTDDPALGHAGYLLPMGGHKGFALSLAVDIISGVLSGGAFLFDIKSMYRSPDDPSETCHTMIAINPEAIMDKDTWTKRMAAFKKSVKDSPMWDEKAEMLLPGELEYRSEQKRQAEGIPLPSKLFNDLNDLAAKLGIEARLQEK